VDVASLQKERNRSARIARNAVGYRRSCKKRANGFRFDSRSGAICLLSSETKKHFRNKALVCISLRLWLTSRHPSRIRNSSSLAWLKPESHIINQKTVALSCLEFPECIN
jgi:hypothetical protein